MLGHARTLSEASWLRALSICLTVLRFVITVFECNADAIWIDTVSGCFFNYHPTICPATSKSNLFGEFVLVCVEVIT